MKNLKLVMFSITCLVFILSSCVSKKEVSSSQGFDRLTKTPVLIARTVDDMAFLEYSDGQVRLGADKMGFLDRDIRLVITDSVEDRYKVQLAKNWSAYIPKRLVSVISKDTLTQNEPRVVNTGSWHLSGKEGKDTLAVALPEKLPYRSYELINPNKIVVDVFGAVSNTTWVTQLSSAEIVKNVYQEQIENDVYRINIELYGKQNWGYRIGYDEGRLLISVKHPPVKKGIENLFIAIDAGHGGSMTGTQSPDGAEEKKYTLKFALELQKFLLEKGVKNVHMVRTADIDFPTPDRVLSLRKIDPDILLSLHLNSSSNPDISGVSTYYKHQGSKRLSKLILDEMLKLDLNEFGHIANFNFLLNSPIEYPNALVEIAFLSNREDEEKVLSKEFREDTAEQIYKGVKKWLSEMQEL